MDESNVLGMPKWFLRWHTHAFLFAICSTVCTDIFGRRIVSQETFMQIVILMLLIQVHRSLRRKEKLT